ncbi:DegT/DnrJ/EryC1/StrS family aminotransferase [Amycolatopsis sp. NPDC006131]|uniref:DegT/DnrJ/EryC1/StrS family aminotransferase n=1 Tax=Amycolatopsis sp. NPDC006131 TaxID=3156731 RepID=UPI0033BCE9A2
MTGGSDRIPLAEPELSGNEKRYVQECLETGYVSSVGPFVDRFEREFAESIGGAHTVACASGTAALHVALRLAGAGTGSLVAVSTLTFIASANAAAYTGADLWLVDSEPRTWNMDTHLLHDEVVRAARAGRRFPDVVEVVHLLGHPADIEPLLDLRERFGVRIVEDAAEALGAGWSAGPLAGRHVGTVGDYGCFSFNGNKMITSGGGGMITTADGRAAAKARHLTTQARLPERGYWHDEVGYNYRMTNVAAAIGLAQLEQLPKKLAAKQRIAARYNARLEQLAVELCPHEPWATPSHWIYSILTSEPDPLIDALAEKNIEARRLWPPVHRQPPYLSSHRLGRGVADSLYQRAVSLPSSVHLSEIDQDRVLHEVVQTVNRSR